MIQILNLTKCFGTKVAVDNLSVDIEDGVSGLVGENGAGKSTLFRLISGVYEPDSGEVTVDGEPCSSKIAKENVFFLSDEPFFNVGDSPLSLYDSYAAFYEIDKQRYLELIEKFGLNPKGKLVGFSKGMKRQTFIALSLSINVKYLLLDEAFDGLDPLVLESIKEEIIKKAQSGSSVVISTHNIALLDKLADRFIVLSRGVLANNQENEDKADKMVKLQLFFGKDFTKEDFQRVGIDVVSYKKTGSVIHIVLLEDPDIKIKIEKLGKPIIMEKIPLDREETIKLMMLSAKEGR